MTSEELILSLKDEPMERLRWTVLRAFNVLPCSEEAKSMSDEDCLRFAAHMLVDRTGGVSHANPNFNMERFMNIREAEDGR